MLPISRPIQHGFLRVPGGLLTALDTGGGTGQAYMLPLILS